jgi:hypothetical protein
MTSIYEDPPIFDLRKEYGDKWRVTWEEGHTAREIEQIKFQIIKGRRGELNAWDLETIEVLVLSNTMSNRLKYEGRWVVKNEYDDGMCFIVPKQEIDEACKVIKAKKVRHLSPKQRESAFRGIAKMNSTRAKCLRNGVPAK